MVAGIYFIVYLAVVWLYIVGTENVVYAEVKSFLIVRPSESFSCCGEAVFEYCRYFVARVGNGVVVEVSADHSCTGAVVEVGKDGIHLFGPAGEGLSVFGAGFLPCF